MKKLISPIFSSISVKLFLSFWLITIASIVITRFISSQLEQQSTIIQLHDGDLKKLGKITERINKKNNKNINVIIKKAARYRGTSILLKETESQRVLHNSSRHIHPIATYVENNNLSSVASFQFPYARVTGPKLINIDGKSYQLFLVTKAKHTDVSALFMQLPYWIRFIIPLFISGSLCWLLARSLIKPIVAIQHAAAKIGQGHYQTRVIQASSRQDELGALSKSFNRMAETLEINSSANQRLLADVSHELRSPLTRLQIALGLVEQSAQGNEKITKHIDRCEQEITQLDTMIESVLSLSRMENSFQKTALQLEKIDEVIHQAIENAQYLANEKHIAIIWSSPLTLTLNIDSKLILSSLNNVLVNAIKVSKPHSTIELTTVQTKNTYIITIADSAIGVEESKLSLLFTPFYRISTSRERETGGTGLGLAIAKQAISAHKGDIYAQNNASGGLTITIELPLNTDLNT